MSTYALAAWIIGTGLVMAGICFAIDRLTRWLDRRWEAHPRG